MRARKWLAPGHGVVGVAWVRRSGATERHWCTRSLSFSSPLNLACWSAWPGHRPLGHDLRGVRGGRAAAAAVSPVDVGAPGGSAQIHQREAMDALREAATSFATGTGSASLAAWTPILSDLVRPRIRHVFPRSTAARRPCTGPTALWRRDQRARHGASWPERCTPTHWGERGPGGRPPPRR